MGGGRGGRISGPPARDRCLHRDFFGRRFWGGGGSRDVTRARGRMQVGRKPRKTGPLARGTSQMRRLGSRNGSTRSPAETNGAQGRRGEPGPASAQRTRADPASGRGVSTALVAGSGLADLEPPRARACPDADADDSGRAPVRALLPALRAIPRARFVSHVARAEWHDFHEQGLGQQSEVRTRTPASRGVSPAHRAAHQARGSIRYVAGGADQAPRAARQRRPACAHGSAACGPAEAGLLRDRRPHPTAGVED